MERDDNRHTVLPSPSRAWFTVGVLFAAYIASFVDRTMLSLLVAPIKHDLGLGDIQISLVGGLAFGIFYAVMGLPLGWLADRFSRRLIVAVGVTVWSMATIGCGIAQSFQHLFLARMFVGIGEAALAPAALSLIAANFPPERRALPIAVFVSAGSVGGGLAMIFGGKIVEAVSRAGIVGWPLLGTLEPWQSSFAFVGLLGLPIALLALTIAEPGRSTDSANVITGDQALDWGTLLPLFVAMALLSVVAYGYLAWIPELFQRRFGWSPGDVGTRFGSVFLISGAAGALAGGAIAKTHETRAPARKRLRLVSIGLSLLVAPAIAAPIAPNGTIVLVLLAPVMFLFALPSATAVAAIQDLAPATLRGRVTAGYYLTINLVGLSTGGTLIAFLANAHGGLGGAISILSACVLPLAAACAWLALRSAGKRS